MAISDRPNGGFRDLGAPLVGTEADGVIDPALMSVGGQLFLFYKLDRNLARQPTVIVGRRLSADGLHVAGPQVELLRSHPGGWEQGIVEGPAPIHLGDTTYLLYSEGVYSARGYAEGEALRTGDPLGPYRSISATPMLQGNRRWAGTGGGSIVTDGAHLVLAYAAFRPGEKSLRRLLFIRQLRLAGGILRAFGRGQRIPLGGH